MTQPVPIVEGCTEDSMAKCLDTHKTLNDSIIAKLRLTSVTQKRQFVDGMDKWISTLKL